MGYLSGLTGARPMCDGVQRVFGCGKPRTLGCMVLWVRKLCALGCMVFRCALAPVSVRGFCGPCRGFATLVYDIAPGVAVLFFLDGKTGLLTP